MGAASSKFFPEDDGSAAPTRVTGPSIHPRLASVVSVHTFKIAEITEGGAPGSDADLKHAHQSITQRFKLLHIEMPRRGEGHDSSPEEAFIGIDVADSSHQPLVEKSRFDGPAASLESLLQIGAAEARAEGFRPKPA